MVLGQKSHPLKIYISSRFPLELTALFYVRSFSRFLEVYRTSHRSFLSLTFLANLSFSRGFLGASKVFFMFQLFQLFSTFNSRGTVEKAPFSSVVFSTLHRSFLCSAFSAKSAFLTASPPLQRSFFISAHYSPKEAFSRASLELQCSFFMLRNFRIFSHFSLLAHC